MPRSRRDDLIDTALELFYRDGFHATGIDRVLAASGCAKMTLYHHFRSKDDLILAALARRSAEFGNWFRATVEAAATTPRERLIALFDALDAWFRRETASGEGFRGCAFIKAAAEYGAGDAIHRAAAAHKEEQVRYIEDIATTARAAQPRELAEQLSMLIEGAIVAAQVRGNLHAAAQAKAAAAVLVAGSCPIS